MLDTLTDIVTGGVFAFILVFVRFGTALMIMPGVGDSFVPNRIRLFFALGLCFAVFPVIQPFVPNPVPGTLTLFLLIGMEFIAGIFIGTIARIFITALDTGGMVISMQSGLANAQLFNPSLAQQGSLIGAFMSITGVTLLFVTNLHHLLILGLFESYELFPIGGVPESGSMAELVARAVTQSFLIGVKIGAPFFVLTILIYTGMGILSRLMPQIQVLLLALPMQILVAVTLLAIIVGAAFSYWITQFEQAMVFFLSQGG